MAIVSFVFAFFLPPISKPKTQEKPHTSVEASERLLDAVDDRDLSRVKSLLANDSGRSLARLPIGLLAAGRAIENSYYDIAHYILAVRNQQIANKNKDLPETKKNKNLEFKGGVLTPQPKILIETLQHPPPKISPKGKDKFLKNGSTQKKTFRQDSKQSFSNLSVNTNDVSAKSKKMDPFDPLRTPPTVLPSVK